MRVRSVDDDVVVDVVAEYGCGSDDVCAIFSLSHHHHYKNVATFLCFICDQGMWDFSKLGKK